MSQLDALYQRWYLELTSFCPNLRRNENTKSAERQLKFFVYNLEAACRAADEAGQYCCQLQPFKCVSPICYIFETVYMLLEARLVACSLALRRHRRRQSAYLKSP